MARFARRVVFFVVSLTLRSRWARAALSMSEASGAEEVRDAPTSSKTRRFLGDHPNFGVPHDAGAFATGAGAGATGAGAGAVGVFAVASRAAS